MTFTRRRKFATIVAATAMLWGFAAVPAFAEGDWDSKLTNVSKGFSSRWWTDSNLDSASTRVKFKDCRGGTNSNYLVEKVRVHLWRDNGIFPDHNHGQVTSNCNNTWASWGRMTAVGSYKWTVGDKYVNYYGAGNYAWIPGGRLTVSKLWTEY